MLEKKIMWMSKYPIEVALFDSDGKRVYTDYVRVYENKNELTDDEVKALVGGVHKHYQLKTDEDRAVMGIVIIRKVAGGCLLTKQ